MKKKNTRPLSSKKHLISVASKLAIKPQMDGHLLSRLRPTTIGIDKERLYEDNMALKLALNAFQSENVRIRTRITQLERELSKKDDIIEEISAHEKTPGHKYLHLVNNLKQSLKETKLEIRGREEEITKLRRNIKSTRTVELEVEIQAYVDECSRLTRNLEELARKQGDIYNYSIDENKYAGEIASLKKEKTDLLQGLNRAQEEVQRLKDSEKSSNKKKNGNKANGANLKLEMQKLRAQAEIVAKEFKEKEVALMMEINNNKRNAEEFRGRFEAEERKNREMRKEIEEYKQQIKMIEAVKSEEKQKPVERMVMKKSNPPKLLVKVHLILKANNFKMSGFISIIDSARNGYLEIEEFKKILKKYGKNTKNAHFDEFSEKRGGKIVISLQKLLKMYEEYNYHEKMPDSSSSDQEAEEDKIIATTPSKVPIFNFETSPTDPKPILIKDSEISDYLNHISLCMQLHRLEKSEIPQTIFGKKGDHDKILTKQSLLPYFKNPPFMFMEKLKIDKFCEFLVQPPQEIIEKSKKPILQLSIREIISKLERLVPNWEIFDSDEEGLFDEKLSQVIGINKKKIKRACKDLDKKKTGMLSISDFRFVLKDHAVLLQERIFQYMTLLFYSHEYELDRVPYVHFIKAYGEVNNSESQEQYTDEERAQIVKHYLSEIASAMLKLKVSPKEVFQVDQELIYPESFIAGLEYLGLKNIEHEFVVLILEALQYEHENEACILMEEFEKIMENFGVPMLKSSKGKSSRSHSSKRSSDDTGNEIRKFSIVESENYEYSDDSPEKHGISEISPFASVSHTGFNRQQSSPFIPIASKKVLEAVDSEKSSRDSKNTPTISKIEVRVDRKISADRHSSSDSLRDILEKHDERSQGLSSFGSDKKNKAVSLSMLRDIARAAEADLEKDEEDEEEEEEEEGEEAEEEIEYEDEDFDGSSEDEALPKVETRKDLVKEEEKVADRNPYSPMDGEEYNTSSEFSQKQSIVKDEKNNHSGRNNDLKPEEIDYDQDIDIETVRVNEQLLKNTADIFRDQNIESKNLKETEEQKTSSKAIENKIHSIHDSSKNTIKENYSDSQKSQEFQEKVNGKPVDIYNSSESEKSQEYIPGTKIHYLNPLPPAEVNTITIQNISRPANDQSYSPEGDKASKPASINEYSDHFSESNHEESYKEEEVKSKTPSKSSRSSRVKNPGLAPVYKEDSYESDFKNSVHSEVSKEKDKKPAHATQKSESIPVEEIIEPSSPSIHSPFNRDDRGNASGSHRSTASFQQLNLITPQIIQNPEVKEKEKEIMKSESPKAADEDDYEMDEEFSQGGINENIEVNESESDSEMF